MTFINLAFYRFIDLPRGDDSLSVLRSRLLDACKMQDLRGTILLAPEGVNGCAAGTRDAIDGLKTLLEESFGAPLASSYKESLSEHQPFNRMLVRLKKEIITMGRPDIAPARDGAARLAPATSKAWLDEGRDLVLLDTRNDYEVRLGTFEGAVDLGLQTFRQFPERAQESADRLLPRGKTIVTFCTGGIRCEKAAALLEQDLGRSGDVYQLDGGILRYLEETGGAHFRGECFVFDARVAVDTALRETGAVLCYACQNPVTVEEQGRAEYVINSSCPHCYNRPKFHKEMIALGLREWRQKPEFQFELSLALSLSPH